MWRRFLRRSHPFQLQPMSNELIDGILRPFRIGDDRRFRPFRSFEGPVTGILRPLGNPLVQNLLLNVFLFSYYYLVSFCVDYRYNNEKS